MSDGTKFLLAVAAAVGGICATIFSGIAVLAEGLVSHGILILISQLALIFGTSEALRLLAGQNGDHDANL